MNRRHVFNVAVGLVLLGAGAATLVLLSPLVLDGERFRATIVDATMNPGIKMAGFVLTGAVAIYFVVAGLISIGYRGSDKVLAVNVMTLVTAILFTLVLEGAARYSLARGIAPLNAAALYGNGFCDDRYWKIVALNRGELAPLPEDIYHPVLGWTGRRADGNPEGVLLRVPLDQRPGIPFYGDSFMYGATDPGETVPAFAQQMLGSLQAFNFGVGGYGLDQIYLRYELSAEAFRGRPVVFSIMTRDLDRSALTFRDGPKPYFVADNGALRLEGVPVARDREAWLAAHPVRMTSYALAILARLPDLVLTGFDGSRSACHRDRKIAINRMLLEATLQQARALDQALLGLIFVSSREVAANERDWRHQLLSRLFVENGVPFVDTMTVLRADMENNGRQLGDYFIPLNGHPNALANRLIAEAVVEALGAIETGSRQ